MYEPPTAAAATGVLSCRGFIILRRTISSAPQDFDIRFQVRSMMYRLPLLDVLVPATGPNSASHSQRLARAYEAERMIKEACEYYGPKSADALKALLGLSGDHAAPLYQRRRVAGAFYDVRPRTFTKNYEDDLLMDLAAELWRRTET